MNSYIWIHIFMNSYMNSESIHLNSYTHEFIYSWIHIFISYMNSYNDYMNSYVYEFIWFFHIWIHMFHEFIYEFGCTKVPDVCWFCRCALCTFASVNSVPCQLCQLGETALQCTLGLLGGSLPIELPRTLTQTVFLFYNVPVAISRLLVLSLLKSALQCIKQD